jgi:hypothetical protein
MCSKQQFLQIRTKFLQQIFKTNELNTGVQSINNVFHIVDKVENVLVYTHFQPYRQCEIRCLCFVLQNNRFSSRTTQ